MLVRGASRGRAWHRTGRSDAPEALPRLAAEPELFISPDQLDFAEVWDDWSGGFGDAYRRPEAPNRYHWAENFDLRFPRQAVHAQALLTYSTTAPGAGEPDQRVNANTIFDTPPKPAAEQGRIGAGDVVILGDGYVVSLTPGAGDGRQFNGLADTLTASRNYGAQPAIFGSYSYIPTLTATGFRERDVAGAFTETTMPARGFLNAGNRLWRWHGALNRNYLVQSIAAHGSARSAADWSVTLSVGDQATDIRAAVALDDQVFFGMQNGLFAGDQSGTFVNILPEMAGQRHIDNCRDLTVYNGGVVAPHVGGLLWYYPTSAGAEVRDISPAMRTNRSPVRGRFRAVRTFGPWLYAGLWTGSQSYMLAGRAAGGAGAPDTWHVMHRFPHIAKVSRLHIDGITVSSGGGRLIPNRLWALMDATIEVTGTAPIYYMPIPLGNDNPLNADPVFSANYCGSARLDFPATNRNQAGVYSVFRSVEVNAELFLSGAQYADIYYTVDAGARTLLGRAQTSPKSTIYFPSSQGNFITGQSIALSLESFTMSTNITPVYRSVTLRGALAPKSVDYIRALVRIADNLPDRHGGPMRPGAVMLQELRDMAATAQPYQLSDLVGAESWVKVLNPIDEDEQYHQGDDNPEVLATLRMAVMSFSGS